MYLADGRLERKRGKMTALVIYSSSNSEGRHDATGAFIPEAKEFQKFYSVPEENMLPVPCTQLKADKRREAVCMFLRNKSDIDLVAIACHGWSQGIQMGFTLPHAITLAKYLSMACKPTARIALYCCSTASGNTEAVNIGPATDGGFADVLRDNLLGLGFNGGWIDAHKTAGHCTQNPYVVRFYLDPTLANTQGEITGGDWLVSPKNPLWRAWARNLKKDLRFLYPMKTELEIKTMLTV